MDEIKSLLLAALNDVQAAKSALNRISSSAASCPGTEASAKR